MVQQVRGWEGRLGLSAFPGTEKCTLEINRRSGWALHLGKLPVYHVFITATCGLLSWVLSVKGMDDVIPAFGGLIG